MPRGRPKKPKVDFETERQLNTIEEYAAIFAEGFVSNMFNDGILSEVSPKQLLTYLSDPDNYITELNNLAHYYYITSGEVFQLFELTKVLPTLNYKIEVYDKGKNYEKNLLSCNKALRKVKHKQLTRDIITQLISTGTLTGIWLGDKKNPYFYIFDDMKIVSPAYRANGDWIIQVDMSAVGNLDDLQRKAFLDNLTPYVTEKMYEDYRIDSSKKFVYLPQDRTVCLRTHTLKRNQAYGLNWAITGFFDLQHKKKLKDIEKSIANKIISAVAVLTIGSEKNTELGNLKLNKTIKQKIHSGVKAALEKNQSKGITVVSIPDFASIEFPEMKSDALDPKKFDSINNDVTSAFGTSPAVLNGTGGNFASARISLEVFYKRIAILLEDIEQEVYQKFFKIILPSSVSDDYYLVYDKEPPLTLKEKVDILMKLHTQEGFSLKAVIDLMSGLDFNEYVNQSIYEQEEMKLQEKIKPYASAYTATQLDKSGRPENDEPTSENTIKSKTNNGNEQPT
ncbi:hypothetical protein [Brevibacillus laterosporus]|uniref:Phage portal protein n=2 Tax=Brevibacillus laterosporus TaxID=1465 RepID=A0AAP8U6W2_BRELA|nr:hypothetical protein [Brevibacillus laterosporus]MBG9776190.1 hypothetical protein [Brevibacillus laterosporus]PPB12842.1 hypothetical protein C4A77_00210 [Brevibacillus laterosporus]